MDTEPVRGNGQCRPPPSTCTYKCPLRIKQRRISVAYGEWTDGAEGNRRSYIFCVYGVSGSVLNVLDGLLNLIITLPPRDRY